MDKSVIASLARFHCTRNVGEKQADKNRQKDNQNDVANAIDDIQQVPQTHDRGSVHAYSPIHANSPSVASLRFYKYR